MLYGVTRCPRCGQLFIIHVKTKRTRCRYCNHSYAIRPKREFTRILFHSYSIEECRQYMAEKKARMLSRSSACWRGI